MDWFKSFSAHKSCLSALVLCLLIISCGTTSEVALEPAQIVPVPTVLTETEDQFQITSRTTIELSGDPAGFETVPDYLAETLSGLTGNSLEVRENRKPRKNHIRLELTEAITGNEAYQLSVTSRGVVLKAASPGGLFYGVQTIKQLVQKAADGKFYMSGVEINDSPRFGYRGMHLDVGRHFHPVEFIKKYIDLIALHKMNTFHWHLTEDQGWRIEIKKYPKLTEVGAFRKETLVGRYRQSEEYDGQRYGGFYTQEEIKEVVKYAAERFVTIIPEIEMPGHSLAALAAYPELGCTKGPYEVGTTWGVFKDVYCPTEETFGFLQDVLTEVMDLFPGQYIHIGGDECPKDSWKASQYAQDLIKQEGLADEHELQSYFIRRIEKFLNANNRKLIGWDEILEGGLSPNATVMSWRGTKGGIEAAKLNHNAIMSPYSHCYFDFYQADRETEPLAIGGDTPVEKVYSYEPIPDELTDEQASYILGGQGNVWTEYMKTSDYVEYMALPRMSALSEVLWSPKEKKNYDDFVNRMKTFRSQLDAMNVNYAKHIFQ